MFSFQDRPVFKPLIILLALAGALISAFYAAHLIFLIAFFSETRDIFPTYGAPFLVIALSALLLSLIFPQRWVLFSAAVCVPAISLCVLISISLHMEERWDHGWLLIAVFTLFFGLSLGWVGCMIRKHGFKLIGARKNHG